MKIEHSDLLIKELLVGLEELNVLDFTKPVDLERIVVWDENRNPIDFTVVNDRTIANGRYIEFTIPAGGKAFVAFPARSFGLPVMSINVYAYVPRTCKIDLWGSVFRKNIVEYTAYGFFTTRSVDVYGNDNWASVTLYQTLGVGLEKWYPTFTIINTDTANPATVRIARIIASKPTMPWIYLVKLTGFKLIIPAGTTKTIDFTVEKPWLQNLYGLDVKGYQMLWDAYVTQIDSANPPTLSRIVNVPGYGDITADQASITTTPSHFTSSRSVLFVHQDGWAKEKLVIDNSAGTVDVVIEDLYQHLFIINDIMQLTPEPVWIENIKSTSSSTPTVDVLFDSLVEAIIVDWLRIKAEVAGSTKALATLEAGGTKDTITPVTRATEEYIMQGQNPPRIVNHIEHQYVSDGTNTGTYTLQIVGRKVRAILA